MLGSSFAAPELALIAAVFLIAGGVKGVVGLGLPTVAIGLLTALIGISEGIVLMVIPSLITNIWQALIGGGLQTILRRVWGLLLTIFIGAWIVRDAKRQGINHWITVPFLFATLIAGPAGLMLYLLLRLGMKRTWSLEESALAAA